MFLVRFENMTSSTRSSSGNGAGFDVLYKGTILKGMLPKFKSSKYIIVYKSSLFLIRPRKLKCNTRNNSYVGQTERSKQV